MAAAAILASIGIDSVKDRVYSPLSLEGQGTRSTSCLRISLEERKVNNPSQYWVVSIVTILPIWV